MNQDHLCKVSSNASELSKHLIWSEFGQCEYSAVCFRTYRACCFVLHSVISWSPIPWWHCFGYALTACSDLNPGLQRRASFCVCAGESRADLERWAQLMELHGLSVDLRPSRKRWRWMGNWTAQTLSGSWSPLETKGIRTTSGLFFSLRQARGSSRRLAVRFATVSQLGLFVLGENWAVGLCWASGHVAQVWRWTVFFFAFSNMEFFILVIIQISNQSYASQIVLIKSFQVKVQELLF